MGTPRQNKQGAGGGVVAAVGSILRHPGGVQTRTNPQQFQILVAFMEKHGDLNKTANGGVPHTIQQRKAMWARLSATLNAAGDIGAADRSVAKWQKVWSDLKNNSKKKAMKLANSAGEGSAHLTQSEYRVLKLMGMIKSSIVSAPPASVLQAAGARAPLYDVSAVAPSPTPSHSPSPDRNIFRTAFQSKPENPLEDSLASEGVAEAERSLEDDMFSWPQSVLEGTVMEDNSVLVAAAAPGARLRVARDLGPTLREPAEPPEPRPDARGHTVARERRRGGGGWGGKGRGGRALEALLARDMVLRRKQRARDRRLQVTWQRICERGLALFERFLDRQTPSPAAADAADDVEIVEMEEEVEPVEVEPVEIEPEEA